MFGDNPPSRRIKMVIDLSMKPTDRYTWDEFIGIFDFVTT
jgi:hypothetical protein